MRAPSVSGAGLKPARLSLSSFVLGLAALWPAGCVDEQPNEAPTAAERSEPVALDLWAGVPQLAPHPADIATAIEPRPGPAKPASVSETVELAFPPDAPPPSSKPEVATGPLKIERFGPTGAVGLVDAIRVTFNQPMVPLASVESLATKSVPLVIEPAIAGKTRWLGTQTLGFYPEARLPFSTKYTVRVPAESTSLAGRKLGRELRWTVTTPTLAIESSDPWHDSPGVALDQKVTLTFNQPVRRAALAAALTWKGGGKAVAFKASEPSDAEPMEPWQRDRTVVLTPATKLEPDTRYTISLPPGVFGEGPERSKRVQIEFSTYEPLRLDRAECRTRCSASHGIALRSNNIVVDPKLADKVHISPTVENLEVTAIFRGIHLTGDFVGDTTYKITVDAGVRDEHGQTLVRPFTVTQRLGPHRPSISTMSVDKEPVVIERASAHELALRIAGLNTLELTGIGFSVKDLDKYINPSSAEHFGWPRLFDKPSLSKVFAVRDSRRKQRDFTVELDEMLGQHTTGWLIARSNEMRRRGWKWREGIMQGVVVTDLGIATATDDDSGAIMVTRLSTGEPVPDAVVTVGAIGSRKPWTGTTDTDGVVYPTFTRPEGYPTLVVTAEAGDDAAYLRLDQHDLQGGIRHGEARERDPLAFFFTDRAPYKPGETIHLLGLLRERTRGPKGGTAWWRANATGNYRVVDPRGVEVAKGALKIGPLGTVTLDIPTDENGGTGSYEFSLEVPSLAGPSQSFSHSIPVETFRTPEFTVKVERPNSTPLVYGDELVVDIVGHYLHGAPLAGADVGWTLTRTETEFRPPGAENEAFTFGGASVADWHGFGDPSGFRRRDPLDQLSGRLITKFGKLDARGRLAVKHKVVAQEPRPPGATPSDPAPIDPTPIDPSAPKPLPGAATYTIEANVNDASRQAIAGSGSFVVHPAAVYVGVRSERSVLREGESTAIEAVVVDLEGARTSGTATTIDFVRRETTRTPVEKAGAWVFEYQTTEHRVDGCALASSAAPQRCEVTPDKAGTYVVRASGKDAVGRETRSEVNLYVQGKDEIIWSDSSDRRVDLVADKRKYAPGDTAKILLRSPFTDARGFVVVGREGIASEQKVAVTGGAHAIEVPITDEMVGGVDVLAVLTRGRVEIPGAPKGQDLGIPAAAAGTLSLDVVSDSKAIVVALEPHAKAIAPKGSLSLAIKTTRKDTGAPLPAALAVMVVDEGVLSLMDYKTPDPVSFFHPRRESAVFLHALHTNLSRHADELVAITGPDDADVWGGLIGTEIGEAYGVGGLGLVGTGRGGGGGGEGTIGLGPIGVIGKGGGGGSGSGYGRGAGAGFGGRGATVPSSRLFAGVRPDGMLASEDQAAGFDVGTAMSQSVSLRTVFATTAFFDAEILTDENGQARVDIAMPENLTTFRIMAVAVDPNAADRFGSGESSVRVRKPVMIRPSLPRFANSGDKFEGAAMVDNQTDVAQEVLVGTRGLNVVLSGATERFVEIPAGEAREVRFAMAADKVGQMRLQFAAMSNGGRDATEVTIPVHFPATPKAFADYGMTDASVARTVEPPADALPDFGGLDLSFSSTALSGLQDAVEYLVDYPYECAEQTASRILPIFALGDVLEQFPIATVRDKALRDQLAKDGIKRLLTHQLYDGGFGYWPDDRESWPYLTTWATFALIEGKRRGYRVDEHALERALNYLEDFVRYGHRTRWGTYYDETSRAFGLWLLSGEKRGAELFDSVWAQRKRMPLYARALLMSAAHRYSRTAQRDKIREELNDLVVESARTIHFAESKSEAAADGLRLLMHSSVQTDAIVLMALLEIEPTDTKLPKIIAGIMDERDAKPGGRWTSTHANAWALVAASRYFETIEKADPHYTAQVWIDELFAGAHEFKGRSMTKVDQRIPMATLQGAESRELTIAKAGSGKLYYRMGLRYAPKDLNLAAVDHGFTVYREYAALPGADGKVDPEAVKQTADGDWIVKAGTNVRVTINLVVSDRANYVVVDDPLPAGFDGQNPKFITSVGAGSSSGLDGVRGGFDPWWGGWWYAFNHIDLRDDRMLLFADALPAGVYTHSYAARATTIGEFLLPPIKAEQMYEPERFGHGSSTRVTIVE